MKYPKIQSGKSYYVRSFLSGNRTKFFRILFLAVIAALLEASFVLLLRFLAGAYKEYLHDSGSFVRDLKTIYMVFLALIFMVLARTLFQIKQSRMMVLLVEKWIGDRRVQLFENLEKFAFPVYRESHSARLSRVVESSLEVVKRGIFAWFFSVSSAIQLMVFVPLLGLFPWQLGLTVFVLLVPVLVISRFRISALNRYCARWTEASEKIGNLVKQFSQRIEFYVGNGKFSRNSKSLLQEVEIHERHQSRWEFIQAVFPQIMETLFFLLVTVVILLMMGQEFWIDLEPLRIFPFLVLLLLMYKPVREWSRHYPVVSLGKHAWIDFFNFIEEIKSSTPKPNIKTSTQDLLEISKLDFSYNGFSGDCREEGSFSVFKNFNLKIDPSEIVLLRGANGTGKSTLLKLIARLEFPRGGGIRCPAEWIEDKKLCVGYLSQHCQVETCIKDKLFEYKRELPDRWEALDSILNLSPLMELASDNFMYADRDEKRRSFGTALSGGERQRLCLFQAFTSKGNYLLLDEPTTWLPGEERIGLIKSLIDFWTLGCSHNSRKGTLIASHETELSKFCDRVIEFEGPGKLKHVVG